MVKVIVLSIRGQGGGGTPLVLPIGGEKEKKNRPSFPPWRPNPGGPKTTSPPGKIFLVPPRWPTPRPPIVLSNHTFLFSGPASIDNAPHDGPRPPGRTPLRSQGVQLQLWRLLLLHPARQAEPGAPPPPVAGAEAPASPQATLGAQAGGLGRVHQVQQVPKRINAENTERTSGKV